MSNLNKTIGKSIKSRRKELNLELETLSLHTSVSISVLSNIENGKANPTIKTLEKVLSVLGLTLQTTIIER